MVSLLSFLSTFSVVSESEWPPNTCQSMSSLSTEAYKGSSLRIQTEGLTVARGLWDPAASTPWHLFLLSLPNPTPRTLLSLLSLWSLRERLLAFPVRQQAFLESNILMFLSIYFVLTLKYKCSMLPPGSLFRSGALPQEWSSCRYHTSSLLLRRHPLKEAVLGHVFKNCSYLFTIPVFLVFFIFFKQVHFIS